MRTIDKEDDYDTLVNSLKIIIDNFMVATSGCLEGLESKELQSKLEEVFVALRYAKG
jgi:hypothetical protein